MKFLNPKTDFAFKKIFGSEQSHDILLSFLKYAEDLEVIPAALESEPAIRHAFEIANKAGISPEELEDQERREIFIQDQRGAIELAVQKTEARNEIAKEWAWNNFPVWRPDLVCIGSF